MQIACSQENLHTAIQMVQRASSPRDTLPILGAVLLEAQGGTLSLTATDLELRIQASIPAEVEEEGSLALPARDLADLVRFLPSGPLFLGSHGETPHAAVLSQGDSRWRINGYPVEEFPEALKLQGDTLELPTAPFVASVRKGGAALAREDTRGVFSGILVESTGDGTLHVVSTDTHRLAYAWGTLGEELGQPFRILVPGKNLLEITRLLSGERFRLQVAENWCRLVAGNLVVDCRLLEGQFPAYQQVIPSRHQTRMQIATKELAASIERALVVGRQVDKSRITVVKLRLSGQLVSLDSSSPEKGEMHEELPAKIEGEELEIAFNARYLLEGLQAIGAEEVTIDFTGSLGPAVIRPAQTEEISCLYLVLPVRLS
ncbi:MAG: DNA polymerase III subunit beta [Clostridia bacterium]|nr:DNA polymerase III subunit beta [Clostridia bacterium]